MNFAKIVVPLDGSDVAEQAVTSALPLAAAFGSEVLCVGVLDLGTGVYDVYSEAFDPIELREHMERFLEAALDRAVARLTAAGARARRFLRVGAPHEEITALAAEEAADLILMTTHGRKGLTHLLLGSVTEKVIRTSPCPVMVIRPTPAEDKPA